MAKIFFSMRTFEKDGGGTIRMYGILNALAKKGQEVIFISNAKKFDDFHPNIKHVAINWSFTEQQKRRFQGLLGLIPFFMFGKIYSTFIIHLSKILAENNLLEKEVIFFEYLDNSIGYVLKKKRLVKDYVNDIHGIATFEFKYQFENDLNLKNRIIGGVKYFISKNLDYKVFEKAKSLIFASEAMEKYFNNIYPFISKKNNYILPYVISEDSLNNKVDLSLKQDLSERFKIKPSDFIVFFAGGFKPTAGVEDLITAFASISKKYPHTRLLILGRGDDALARYKILLSQFGVEDRVNFIDSVPYKDLRTYQDLANIIVCPDRMNPYSELIVHLKYFDALFSGKVVVNSGFSSVKELNKGEQLSLNFKPSDPDDLALVLEKSINNFEMLNKRFANNVSLLKDRLTYGSLINSLIDHN